MLQLVKHVFAKFQLSSFYPDGLGQIFVSSKFQNFLKNISKFSNSEKIQIEPFSIFTKISKVILIFLTPEFALEISKVQNSEHEVHQSSPTNEG
jgi:hypothetical protein